MIRFPKQSGSVMSEFSDDSLLPITGELIVVTGHRIQKSSPAR
ncbi:MAG: hypothetical protein AAF539_05305 [Planctomycetota bacterium]